MCEASCPLDRLEALKFSVAALSSAIGADKGSYQRELAHLAAREIQNDIDWCIKQLKAAGEGEKCYDLEAFTTSG